MKCQLPGCGVKLKPPKRKFCCNKHKDRYHNLTNPRGIYAHLAVPDVNDMSKDEQAQDLDDYYYATSHPGDPDSLGQD
jgi:hypothetical protein